MSLKSCASKFNLPQFNGNALSFDFFPPTRWQCRLFQPNFNRNPWTCTQRLYTVFAKHSDGMVFRQQQWIFMLEYYLDRESYSNAIKKFRKKYPDAGVPNNSTMTRLADRLDNWTRRWQDWFTLVRVYYHWFFLRRVIWRMCVMWIAHTRFLSWKWTSQQLFLTWILPCSAESHEIW